MQTVKPLIEALLDKLKPDAEVVIKVGDWAKFEIKSAGYMDGKFIIELVEK